MSVPSFSLQGLARKHTIIPGDGTAPVEFEGPVVLKSLASGEVTCIGSDNDDDAEVTYPIEVGEVLSLAVKKVVSHTLGAGNLIAWE